MSMSLHRKQPLNINSHEFKYRPEAPFGRDCILQYALYVLSQRRLVKLMLNYLSRYQYNQHKRKILTALAHPLSESPSNKTALMPAPLPRPVRFQWAEQSCHHAALSALAQGFGKPVVALYRKYLFVQSLRVLLNQRRLDSVLNNTSKCLQEAVVNSVKQAVSDLDSSHSKEMASIRTTEVQLMNDLAKVSIADMKSS